MEHLLLFFLARQAAVEHFDPTAPRYDKTDLDEVRPLLRSIAFTDPHTDTSLGHWRARALHEVVRHWAWIERVNAKLEALRRRSGGAVSAPMVPILGMPDWRRRAQAFIDKGDAMNGDEISGLSVGYQEVSATTLDPEVAARRTDRSSSAERHPDRLDIDMALTRLRSAPGSLNDSDISTIRSVNPELGARAAFLRLLAKNPEPSPNVWHINQYWQALDVPTALKSDRDLAVIAAFDERQAIECFQGREALLAPPPPVPPPAKPDTPAASVRMARVQKGDSWDEFVDRCAHLPVPLSLVDALFDFVLDMNAKNAERNTRLDAVEQRIVPLESSERGTKCVDVRLERAPSGEGRDANAGRIAQLEREVAVLKSERAIDRELIRELQSKSTTTPRYKGVYQAVERYEVGDSVTHRGGLWIALNPTMRAPDDFSTDAKDWQLAVKRGRDGKPGHCTCKP